MAEVNAAGMDGLIDEVEAAEMAQEELERMVAPFDSSCSNQGDCPKTLDVCLEQIKAGQAWWYKSYAKEQTPEDQSKYEQAEFQAKIHRNGLWADTNPVPPWSFRREGK